MENKVMLMIDALKDGFNRFADFLEPHKPGRWMRYIRAGLVIKRVCQWLPTVSSSIYLHLFHMQGDLDAHRPQCHENVIKNLFSLS